MEKYIGGFACLALVVFSIAKDPNPYKKMVRDAVGVEEPTPEQVEWKRVRDRLVSGADIPRISMPADKSRKSIWEIIGNGTSTGTN